MPYEIGLEQLPAGFVAEDTRKGDTHANVWTTKFVSTEDGDLFVLMLEGISSVLLRRLPVWPPIPEGRIEHLLAIIRPDKSATLYINELKFTALMQIKGPFAQGDPVFNKDIADIETVVLGHGEKEITVPADAGVIFLFSVGWRKGLFYDLRPLMPPKLGGQLRDFDLSRLFGQYYAYLMFQDLFKITESDWAALTKQRWFPFISLMPDTIRAMISHARSGEQVDELLPDIQEQVVARIPLIRSKWEASPYLKPHQEFLEKAAERYVAGDHKSATSILFPRIEGIMRGYHECQDHKGRASQDDIVQAVVGKAKTGKHGYSLLLPHKFREYLQRVYFADFHTDKPETTKVISRHTVAHGVAPAEAFNLKASTLGLLIVDQLSFYFHDKRVRVQ
jgi:hypothetical protein